MIHTQDPYLAHYVFEKSKDPDAPIVWRRFEKRLVDQVDHLVELSRGNRDSIKTEDDWKVLGEILKFFANEWPHEFEQFKSTIPDIRATRRDGGMSSTKEIKYVAALPPRFEKLIKAVFPFQSFDKKFIYRLIRRFPVFRVGGA